MDPTGRTRRARFDIGRDTRPNRPFSTAQSDTRTAKPRQMDGPSVFAGVELTVNRTGRSFFTSDFMFLRARLRSVGFLKFRLLKFFKLIRNGVKIRPLVGEKPAIDLWFAAPPPRVVHRAQ